MRPLRVRVVDDSAFNRKIISGLLEAVEGVSVVGKASSGEEALRMLGTLEPDLITLDLEMPRMDGFSFLRFVMARRPTPVIVVSSRSAKQNVFRALELGALDFVAKPTATPGEELSAIGQELVEKVSMVRQLRPRSFETRPRQTVSSVLRAAPRDQERPLPKRDLPRHIVVVGASTGGPSALVELFGSLRSDMAAAVLVVQHMPPRFTRTFAERLDRLGGLRVSEGVDGDRLRAGRAVVCPGGHCLEVDRGRDGFAVRIVQPNKEDRYVPSIDRTMRSVASAAGQRAIGVVLTGMGDDGALGVVDLAAAGGRVLVQSPEDAMLDGMPKHALRSGVSHLHLPLKQLAESLAARLR